MDRITSFISYASSDKKIAGKLKRYLMLYCGFDVFLAHEDMQPSIEWEKEIMEAIKKADYFIPLISEGFKTSDFTDQEVGAAVCMEKRIIPVKLQRISPYGFMSRYQAFQYKLTPYQNSITDNILQLTIQVALLTRYYKDDVLNLKATNSIIFALFKSSSFDASNTIIKIICQMRNLNQKHIELIKKAIELNSQVAGAFDVDNLKYFLQNEYNIKV